MADKHGEGPWTAFLFNTIHPDLTPDQANHITRIAKEFCMTMAAKYTKGQREHGGNLYEMDPGALLDNAILEAIDQVVYLLTLKERLGHGPA